MILINIDKILARTSVVAAVDFRNYYSSKSLYSVTFFKEYVSFINPAILSATGRAKKAIIFDCDNTLWNGIIGEDLTDGIAMSAATSKGVVYEEVQWLVKELVGKGIIIGLNSKNNPNDVEEILRHESMSIANGDISVKRVNWNDKVSNLKEIATELNIGMDSIVFVDDSDFEINLIRNYLPQIETIQVPAERYLYPSEIRKKNGLFFNLNTTREDIHRAKMYVQEAQRKKEQTNYDDIEAYIKSLELELKLYIDIEKHVPRIAQLTQKTNQFNLTTKRYTETEILHFVRDPNYHIFAFEVKDRYGDFGLTGEAFVSMFGNEAVIDTFLMSCRVLGRNVEYKFIHEIFSILRKESVVKVRARYIKTLKNEQVQDFYEKMGFTLVHTTDTIKDYEIDIQQYKVDPFDYIKVKYEG